MRHRIIILIIMLVTAIFITVNLNAQTITWSNPICDETEVKASGKSGAIRVITANIEIARKVASKFPIKKMVQSVKQDRKGYYTEYSLYCDKEYSVQVINFLKSLN